MWRCAFNRILVEGHKDGRFTRSTKVAGLDDDSSGKYGHGASNAEMELCESWYFAVGFQLERPLYNRIICILFVFHFPSKPHVVVP